MHIHSAYTVPLLVDTHMHTCTYSHVHIHTLTCTQNILTKYKHKWQFWKLNKRIMHWMNAYLIIWMNKIWKCYVWPTIRDAPSNKDAIWGLIVDVCATAQTDVAAKLNGLALKVWRLYYTTHINGWMHKCSTEQMNEWTDEWTAWTNERTDEQRMNWLMDEWQISLGASID